MQQLVRVRTIHEDGTATVMHIRESACSGDCHKCSGCGAAKEAILLEAVNPIGAKPGDLVTVEAATGPVLKAALVMYMVPMVPFFSSSRMSTMDTEGSFRPPNRCLISYSR